MRQKQETHKGLGALDPAGTSWAGWGFAFNFSYQMPAVTSSWSGVVGPGLMSSQNGAYPPPSVQTEYTLFSELGEHPVFLRSPSAMFSSNITSAARSEMLSKGIPALSGAMGRTMVDSLPNADQRNFDMDTTFKSDDGAGWPRIGGDYNGRWLHSDMKDVAYFYTHELFEKLVEEGDSE